MSQTTFAQALNQAMRDEMTQDENVIVMGEDVGALGGVFRITDGLTRDFGEDRCIDTPLAEAGIAGFAVGMAMQGFRPVIEMQFDALFREHYPRIFAFVLRRCQNRATAEEIANEAFLTAWRRWDDLPEDIFPWLAATARKLLANARRGDSRRVPATWDGDDYGLINPAQSLEEQVVQRRLFQDAFDRLKERDREILQMIFWDGFTNREAATALGCSYSVFTLRLHRARKRFARSLGE